MHKKRFLASIVFCSLIFSLFVPIHAFALEDPLTSEVKAAVLVDVNTNEVAYERNAHEKMYPASLTKVLTALLVFDAVKAGRLSMDDVITAPQEAFDPTYYAKDGSTANIKIGEEMTVRNLLYCMLVVSANEAANILAYTVGGGSIEAFVEQMNTRAAGLGCKNAHFVNPSGIHDASHYASPWDMYLITKAAMAHEDFMLICDTASTKIPATNMSGERALYTTNHLLSQWRVIGYLNPEAHGIKTGSTSDAGYCLISSATRGRITYVSVVMGANRTETNGVGNIHSFSETSTLLSYGFENFSYEKILNEQEIISEIPVELSKSDYVTLRPQSGMEVLFPKDLKASDLERRVTLDVDTLEAPVEAGMVVGSMTLTYDNKDYGTIPLVTTSSVEADRLLVFQRDVREFFARKAVRIAIITIVALIVLFFIFRIVTGSKSRRYGRKGYTGGGGSYRGRRRR